MSNKKKVIISIASIIVIIVIAFTFYYLNKSKTYNKFVSDGDHAVTAEQYDKAITLYEEALSYKKDEDVNQKIKFAKLLEKSKEIYTTAVKQMAGKDYLTAIDTFKKVNNQDIKRYKTAQNKINKCKKLYIADNLKSANDSLSIKNFDNANKYVANILKIDNDNADAKKVKDSIAKAVQKQKDDEATAQAAKSQQASNGPMSFEQALQIVLKAEFPNHDYCEKDGPDGYVGYRSNDYKGFDNSDAKCYGDLRGRSLSYSNEDKTPRLIEASFNGVDNPQISKECYNFNLFIGGKLFDGYYAEASTGNVYKWHNALVKKIN